MILCTNIDMHVVGPTSIPVRHSIGYRHRQFLLVCTCLYLCSSACPFLQLLKRVSCFCLFLSPPLPLPIPSYAQRLGCDGVLGSDKVLDKCGRCLHPQEVKNISNTCRQFVGQNLLKDLRKGSLCVCHSLCN